MHPTLEKTYQTLQSYRTRTDLVLKREVMPNLRETFIHLDGEEHDLRLRYYQVQGVLHLVSMNRFLLGDDTGLGKTLMTIASLCIVWNKNPDQKVIVLSPKSALSQWRDEIHKFTEGIQVFVADGGPDKRQGTYLDYLRATGPCVLVINYERSRIDFRTFQRWKNYILVADEASKFKNPDSQIHQVVRYFARHASRTWFLTATLIKNNLIEAYAIMEAMFPGTFGAKTNFIKRYTKWRWQRISGNKKVRVVTGYSTEQIEAFKERIDPFFLGRAKFEVAKELPALIKRRIVVELQREQHIKYQQSLGGLIHLDRVRYDDEGKQIFALQTNHLTQLTRCQQIVDHPSLIDCDGGSAKLDALLELLEDEFAGEKVIVFSRFSSMVDILMPALKKKGYHPVQITGSDTEKQRKISQDRFQNPKSKTQVICITTAAGEAINLQAANALVFYDLPYSAGDYLQILGRMIRIGSLHQRCFAAHLVAEDTIDVHVEKILEKKMKLIEAVVGKRIKGEDDQTIIKQENEISDVFRLMIEDAKRTATL